MKSKTQWLLVPAVALLLVFFVVPVGLILWRSFSEGDPTWHSTYDSILTESVTWRVLGRTLLMALTVTIVTLALGYPYAYLMTRVGRTWRGIMLALVLLPFWTSLMARTFAWYVLLQDNGQINKILGLVGLGPYSLIRTTTGVTIAMTQVLLPFMVLPLYSAMSRIDPRLVDAAISLGAPPRTAFRKVFLPLSQPGVIAGAAITAILALGFYITPKIIGSPRESVMAQLIDLQVSRLTDFGRAGALSLLLLIVTGLLIFLVSRVMNPAKALGLDDGGA
jgi:putative spermidine/putrescine transport system permease protein